MKIYVACLAAYNNGILHGSWVDVSSDIEEMQERIDTVLRTSPMPNAEEWAVHDYDGFPNLGEYPFLDHLCWVFRLIEQSSLEADTVAAVLSEYSNDLAFAEKILDDNHGVWNDWQTFSDELADEMLGCANCDQWVKNYFDYEQYARDTAMNYTVIEVPDGVLISGVQ